MYRSSLLVVLAALSISYLTATATAADYLIRGNVSVSYQSQSFLEGNSYSHDLQVSVGDHMNYDSFGPNQPSYHASASSYAGPDGLHAFSHSEMEKISTGDGFYTYSQTATGYAQGTWSDVIISGPTGSGNINVSYNVHLDGSLIVASDTEPSGVAHSGASLALTFWGGGSILGSGDFSQGSSNGTNQAPSGEGSLASFTGNNVITSPTFSAPVNTPFSIELQLSAVSSVQGWENEPWDLIANTDFGDTLTFATDRPVFNLPAGYTVASNDANIHGNSYTVPELRGDFNLDGHINASDIAGMEQALTNLSAYEQSHGNLMDSQVKSLGDINQDGKFNNADLQALLTLLKSGGGSSDPVPEPASWILASLALMMVSGTRFSVRCVR
jgi:hypothetical protein